MYVVNTDKNKKEASIRLYGEIGMKVDGDIFASELAGLDSWADVVHLHINSPGGDVFQGMSIVSSMLTMKAFIHAHIDGIAASMAAVIAVSADRITMQDFARIMIHDPFIPGRGEKNLSDKLRKMLRNLADMLHTVLSRRGKSKEEIAGLTAAETWFSAEEAKKEGLCDEIEATRRKEQFASLTTDDILAKVAAEYIDTKSNSDMDLKKIAKKLGLPDSATEDEVLAAIERNNKDISDRRKADVDALLERGVNVGLVTEKNQKDMIALAESNLNLLKSLIESCEDKEKEAGKKEEEANKAAAAQSTGTEGYTRLSEAIKKMGAAGASGNATAAGTGQTKTWDWYQKNDPKALQALEHTDPAAFKALLDDYEGSI